VFEWKAKFKGITLAWIKHGNGCRKGYGCKKWKEESKLRITNSKIKLANPPLLALKSLSITSDWIEPNLKNGYRNTTKLKFRALKL